MAIGHHSTRPRLCDSAGEAYKIKGKPVIDSTTWKHHPHIPTLVGCRRSALKISYVYYARRQSRHARLHLVAATSLKFIVGMLYVGVDLTSLNNTCSRKDWLQWDMSIKWELDQHANMRTWDLWSSIFASLLMSDRMTGMTSCLWPSSSTTTMSMLQHASHPSC
jgi:hypothetical protein